MTKKDYELIARALRREIGSGYVAIVESLAHELWLDNERFNKEKFEDACGLGPKEA